MVLLVSTGLLLWTLVLLAFSIAFLWIIITALLSRKHDEKEKIYQENSYYD